MKTPKEKKAEEKKKLAEAAKKEEEAEAKLDIKNAKIAADEAAKAKVKADAAAEKKKIHDEETKNTTDDGNLWASTMPESAISITGGPLGYSNA